MDFIKHFGLCTPWESWWRPETHMPDQSGRIFVITGIDSGIGYESTKHLLAHGASVFGICRCAGSALPALKTLVKEVGEAGPAIGTKRVGALTLVEGDLASLQSTKAASEEICRLTDKLHVLITNAGYMGPRNVTVDGYEMHMGINCLGHHLLINALLPTMIRTARSDGIGRLVIVASSAHAWLIKKPFDPKDPQGKDLTDSQLYARSKLATLQQAQYLARALESANICVCSVHPGNIRTNITRHTVPPWLHEHTSLALWRPYYGCVNQLYAATAHDVKRLHGAYLIPWAKFGTPTTLAQDPKKAKTTWRWCDKQIGKFGVQAALPIE